MAFCIESVIRRISSSAVRKLSNVAEPARLPEEPLPLFRTNECNPVNHTIDHLKRFYTIPPNERKRLFFTNAMPKAFEVNAKTFNECSIMIRRPFLEIISYLHQCDYSRPVNKFVIYGETGSGKSVSLMHMVHYGHMSGHIVVHVPWLQRWYEFPKEYAKSHIREGLTDLPIESATWLGHFKIQNKHLLQSLDLRTSKDYVWSARESNLKGTPILDIIDFGTSRIKFASEIIITLMQELKQWCADGKCKVMVIIDGYNALLSNHTRVRNENKQFIPTKEVTITHAFLDITKSDWNNGAVIVGVDKDAVKETKDSVLPRYLLQKEGFEHLDPFIPVKVEKYDDGEFEMMIEYYKDRKWIRNLTPKGYRELQLLTDKNPGKLSIFCASL
ncbi:28S ribosomal protein S29, mitochondrial [Leptopilina heterotoma]|uniref:28S ribosomal protein S29, mitochondrial n=1 Tax=Leptopilina heterotoma TaxID=63436 RepID=UPI001CAA2FF7|nr:28S ribosomal protein S29, mitochondrial [Leptopilina heterotoma]